MKKLVALFVVAGMVSFVACGPKKDKEADQKKLDSLKQDSIAKVEKAKADSLAEVAKKDSIAKADSLAKLNDKKDKKDGKKDDGKTKIKNGRG
jgi:hypothetical protein